MSEAFTLLQKRKKILLYLKKLQIDIAYLQETHLLMSEVEKLNTLGWKILAAAPFTYKARGVVILGHGLSVSHFTFNYS